MGAGHESTDDAQVEGRITQVATRVGGPIIQLNVSDNQYVEKGTVLAQIDPREYQVALDHANAELADARANAIAAGINVPIATVSTTSDIRTAAGGLDEAQAGITVSDSQVEAARAQLRAAEARVRERVATATRAARDVERLKPLVAKEEIAQQQFDAAVSAADAAQATAEAAEADVAAARTAVAVAEQRAVQARAGATRAEASVALGEDRSRAVAGDAGARRRRRRARASRWKPRVAQAQLNLERTTIKAPADGIVGKQAPSSSGSRSQPGQPLFAHRVARRRLGDRQLQGDAARGDASGPARRGRGRRARRPPLQRPGRQHRARRPARKFSLLPPENATGNYVKVVQRVPVKIVLDQGQDPDHLLRPGMSVVPTVYTK